MSKDWFTDIQNMHKHYGMDKIFENMDEETCRKFLDFRIDFIQEELTELDIGRDDPEEVVDALIDICVVAIDALNAFGIDGHKAWDEVLRANMAKKIGVNESRVNPLGLPDLVKPSGWVAPSHFDNHGRLPKGE